MQAQANVGHPFTSIAFALVGLFCLVAGTLLFTSRLAVAGYGLWIFVWGLAFLIGALSRYPLRST